MHLLPYPVRPHQAEGVRLVEATAREGGQLVLEAPTGSGKTVLLLTGALEAIEGTARRVLYVTRTNSQQDQALREIVAIRRHTGRDIRAFPLQGRHRLCLKLEEGNDPDREVSTPEELSHYCGHAKAATEADPGSVKSCVPYAGLLRLNGEQLRNLHGPDPRSAESFKEVARSEGFCSYEATKRLVAGADVLIAPYVFAFNPGLRRRLMEWWGMREEDVVLVVDEAHNLPGYLRELHSPRLGRDQIRRALAEADDLGNPPLFRQVSVRAFLEPLQESVERIVAEYCQDEDAFIPPFELEASLLGAYQWTTSGLLQAADALAPLGEIAKDRRRLQGRVPRSSLAAIGLFLRHWVAADEEGYVKLAVRAPQPALEAFLVDAERAADVLQRVHATLHASGTLAPLAEYRDSLGLPEATKLVSLPTPFPPDRLRVVVARGLSTKYDRLRSDPRLADRLQETTRDLLERGHVSTAVFFPSHQLLEEFQEVGVFPTHGPQLLVETRSLSQEALMQLVAAHRRTPGRSLLVGVLGGRLSEGLDFPGRQLEAVIVVGAPFPKPTAHQRALFHYYETRHGKGWEYAVRAPTVRRLRQALGRLIRGPTDRGFAIVLDERAHVLLQEAGIHAELEDPPRVAELFQNWQAPTP